MHWSCKIAEVVLFPKHGKDPKFPQNRRPISLLSYLGKIYEKTILERMKKSIFTNALISNEQFGFMLGCSTTHRLIRLMEYVISGFKRKMITVSVILDINEAYDSTWHRRLIYKLISMNFPSEFTRVIDSFLAQTSLRVKMDGDFSGWRAMLAGVPQGSLLSPLLYNLYTSDIPKAIVSELALYADDIYIYDQTKKTKYAYLSVKRHVDDIGRWASRSRIKINTSKSNTMTFSRKTKLNVPRLMFDNVYINYVQE